MTMHGFHSRTWVLVAVLFLGACTPTVSPEGYVSETPYQRYMRNMPMSYSGQRPAVLKPPSAPAVRYETSGAPSYTYSAPASPEMMDPPAVTSQTLTPPSPMMMQDTPPQQQSAPPRIQLMPPPVTALQTREVDYGDSITIYPLDRADAAMPYIPPAYQPPVPLMQNRPLPRVQGYNP